jgi:hypothetical protein
LSTLAAACTGQGLVQLLVHLRLQLPQVLLLLLLLLAGLLVEPQRGYTRV